ncbi:fucose mutarotase [Folsomia candida]|uniref:L-fucose mutarotase n=1 Tax=Folsomia candida TaxID=158441 RepID=A0A226DMS1_FOLCA|nr:fucose mutarotase [Folsomia candida]XP_021960833.1 fucose mutarotase [Folsomia candida]OXA45506.1 Fucose mutarotase [Folsomia candida]
MGFLKGVPPCISPDLLVALAKMGHGDEIVLADAHFPAHSIGKSSGATVLRADGIPVPILLSSIMRLINLDTYVTHPATVMAVAEQDKGLKVPIWDTYSKILKQRHNGDVGIAYLERFEFYERAKRAVVIVQTGETAKYGNIILTNGLVTPQPEIPFWES